MPDTLAAISRATERERLLLALRRDYDGHVEPPANKLGAIEAVTKALATSGVDYALIGGVAVGIRSGVPRATLDVDFAVSSGADRASLVERMASHGIRLRGRFAHSLNFVHDGGEPVQLAFDPVFDPMIDRAEPMRFGDVEVRVVTTEELDRHEEASGGGPWKASEQGAPRPGGYRSARGRRARRERGLVADPRPSRSRLPRAGRADSEPLQRSLLPARAFFLSASHG